jgi:hypothetical protein
VTVGTDARRRRARRRVRSYGGGRGRVNPAPPGRACAGHRALDGAGPERNCCRRDTHRVRSRQRPARPRRTRSLTPVTATRHTALSALFALGACAAGAGETTREAAPAPFARTAGGCRVLAPDAPVGEPVLAGCVRARAEVARLLAREAPTGVVLVPCRGGRACRRGPPPGRGVVARDQPGRGERAAGAGRRAARVAARLRRARVGAPIATAIALPGRQQRRAGAVRVAAPRLARRGDRAARRAARGPGGAPRPAVRRRDDLRAAAAPLPLHGAPRPLGGGPREPAAPDVLRPVAGVLAVRAAARRPDRGARARRAPAGGREPGRRAHRAPGAARGRRRARAGLARLAPGAQGALAATARRPRAVPPIHSALPPWRRRRRPTEQSTRRAQHPRGSPFPRSEARPTRPPRSEVPPRRTVRTGSRRHPPLPRNGQPCTRNPNGVWARCC